MSVSSVSILPAVEEPIRRGYHPLGYGFPRRAVVGSRWSEFCSNSAIVLVEFKMDGSEQLKVELVKPTVEPECKSCGREIPHIKDRRWTLALCKECREAYYKEYIRNGKSAYSNIQQRCQNERSPAYKWYGAKGVKCILTRDEFIEIYFRTDICENPTCGRKLDDEDRNSPRGRTIDRVNPEGNYEEDNVRIVCRKCNTESK